jgi:GT2 family glycosyltransferase
MNNFTSRDGVAREAEAESDKRVVALKCGPEPSRMLGAGYVMLEHAVEAEGRILVVGWVSKGAKVLAPEVIGHARMTRPDADALIGAPTVGFAMVLRRTATNRNVGFFIDAPEMLYELMPSVSKREADIERALDAARLLVPSLLPSLIGSPYWGRLALRVLTPENTSPDLVRGHIDQARSPGIGGGLAIGWAVARGPVALYLVSQDGVWRPLAEAARFHRDDITTAFEGVFGPHTAEAGFVSSLPGVFRPGERVSLVAALRDRLVSLHEVAWEAAPADPVSFARWAFTLPTPPSRFGERLAAHDGPIVEALIEAEAPNRKRPASAWWSGARPAAAQVSVIVPLYGRTDFVEHQLLAFSEDADVREGRVELVYVLDDPRIVEPLRGQAPWLEKLYGVPFGLVWGGINRGFSGANNLGAAQAQAPVLIFLNSDVFPQETGWATRMARVLGEREEIGALGARLDYPDGSVQHLGMRFGADAGTGFWLNLHPIPAPGQYPAGSDPVEVEAATAACLAVRREDFESVGGFDERYLIGDFEDSDLSLRLRRRRGAVAILPDTRLVHLERQSFRMLGENDFRQNVVWFNAWRHHRLWNEDISSLNGRSGAA